MQPEVLTLNIFGLITVSFRKHLCMYIILGFIYFLTLSNPFGPLCIWTKLGNKYDVLMGASSMCGSRDSYPFIDLPSTEAAHAPRLECGNTQMITSIE